MRPDEDDDVSFVVFFLSMGGERPDERKASEARHATDLFGSVVFDHAA